jgi:hypothetical protein
MIQFCLLLQLACESTWRQKNWETTINIKKFSKITGDENSLFSRKIQIFAINN